MSFSNTFQVSWLVRIVDLSKYLVIYRKGLTWFFNVEHVFLVVVTSKEFLSCFLLICLKIFTLPIQWCVLCMFSLQIDLASPSYLNLYYNIEQTVREISKVNQPYKHGKIHWRSTAHYILVQRFQLNWIPYQFSCFLLIVRAYFWYEWKSQYSIQISTKSKRFRKKTIFGICLNLDWILGFYPYPK
jgi:hypothetical protein